MRQNIDLVSARCHGLAPRKRLQWNKGFDRVADTTWLRPFPFGDCMGKNFWDRIAREAFTKKLKQTTRIPRLSKKVAWWRLQCLKRDEHSCIFCDRLTNLEVHHIQRWVDQPMIRFKVSNGATICQSCHKAWHKYKGKEFPAAVTYYLMDAVTKPKHARQPFPYRQAYHDLTNPTTPAFRDEQFLIKNKDSDPYPNRQWDYLKQIRSDFL